MVYDIKKGFPNLKAAKTIVYDSETNGVKWKTCHVVGHVLTWGPGPDETGYWPVRHEGGGNVENPEKVDQWVRGVMAVPETTKVGHFLKFDMHMAANHEIEFAGPLSCTMVTAALLDENAGRYSLENCALNMPGVPLKKGEALYARIKEIVGKDCPEGRDAMRYFYLTPGDDPLVVDYSAGDGTTTWHLHFAQLKKIAEESLDKVYDVECRNLRTIFNMERRGVRVDEERLQGLKSFMEKRVVTISKKFKKDFNPRSSIDMADLLKKYEKDWERSAKTDRPSFVEKWLQNYPEGRDVIELRKSTNMLNSFINPLSEEHMFNGRVHTTFNQLKMDDYGVVTGRLSSSEPNMQQVPKRDKYLAPLFRSVFRPDPGYVWSANDYSQQEYRVFTDYTQNPMLVKGYSATPPIDIHQMVADLCGVERDPTAKRINLGKLYGMGLPKLCLSLGISLAEGKAIDKKYQQMVPEAKEFLKACERMGKLRGWVKSKLGRRRRFPDANYAHKAGNAVIAMSSADITKLKMAEIHDELDWQIPIGSEGMQANSDALRIMQSFGEGDKVQLSVPLTADSDFGDDWAEATFGKKFSGFK